MRAHGARERCHGEQSAHVRDRQGAEATRKADEGGGEPAAAHPERRALTAQRACVRRGLVHRAADAPPGGVPGVRALLGALRVDAAAGRPQQPRPDPRTARDASAHPPREASRDFTAEAMQALALDRTELEHMLWDRVLHLELVRSGKDVIVDKTPPNTLIWPRLQRCWLGARYVLLLRHPAAVVASLTHRRKDPDHEAVRAEVLGYAEKLEEARQSLVHAHVVRYEELTAEPERAVRGLRAYLGVPWEPAMLEYGRGRHGTFRPKLGDWSSTIKSGRIQRARTADLSLALPPRLDEIARAWGCPTQ
ncbi:sulfotransferase [Streptomyces sp. NPDC000345]|uniref:sulfotransferase n=1 Tax=Streptomyces sp. NPDC000345 TaxID=3364537 RepID=UPI0036BCC042